MEDSIKEDAGKELGEFRLWRAQQAVRLGELSLSEQEKSRDSLSKLAVSLMGWSVSLSMVLLGSAIRINHALPLQAAAIAGGLCSFVAALFCHFTFRMKNWKIAGADPEYFLSFGELGPDGKETPETEYCTERDVLTGTALAYAKAYQHNEQIMAHMARRATLAWTAFLATPAITLLVWAIFSAAPYVSTLASLRAFLP